MQSADPIVAVVDCEQEVASVNRLFSMKHPEVDITWSDHRVVGEKGSGSMIYLVTEFTRRNPVVVAAYASLDDALNRVQSEIKGGRDISFVRVQSYQMGEIVSGTPWLDDPEAD